MTNLSLRERQEQLDSERKDRAAELRRQQEAQFGNDGQFLDTLGTGSGLVSRASSPATGGQVGGKSGTGTSDEELFAAFNA